MIGACVLQDPCLVVLEFIQYGDLRAVVQVTSVVSARTSLPRFRVLCLLSIVPSEDIQGAQAGME
jgi:hypothetical protein